MESSPLISVIIPVFRRTDYLRRAIESVLEQTYPRTEVIVVDDGSGDEWVSRYCLPAGVTLVRHSRQQGPAAARNTGLAASNGDYIAWLDSDDVWLPGKLEAQMEALRRLPAACLAYCHATMVDRDLVPNAVQPLPREVTDDPMRFIARSNSIQSPSCVLARRSAVEQSNGFDVCLKGSEDWDLWINMARFAPFAFDSRPWVLYRTHDGQRSNFGLHRLEVMEAVRVKWLGWAKRDAPEYLPMMRRGYCRALQRHASLCLRYGGGLRRSLGLVARGIRVFPWDSRSYWRIVRILAVAGSLAIRRRR
jgi:glycosyltransferase involved in cell wall biosynthesis